MVLRQGKQAGFTLTELLVVTAVIAVLAAITFPLYKGAVSAAKRTVCISNFTSISRALQMYVADYDDRVPPVNYKYVSYHSGSADRTWVQTLSPYAGDFRLFTCPADTGRGANGTPSGWEGYYAASLRSNLGYNYMHLSPLIQDQAGVWESHPISQSADVHRFRLGSKRIRQADRRRQLGYRPALPLYEAPQRHDCRLVQYPRRVAQLLWLFSGRLAAF